MKDEKDQKVSAESLYGLLIGIDAYPNLNVLKGAIADVKEVEKFLKEGLNVPPENLVVLLNEEATRSRILQEFQALWQNKDIRRGDPILIYYAGHGGLRKANKKWKDRYGAQQIQVIFPIDYKENSDPQNDQSPPVNSIPDRTIATLLNKLAFEKGDNITVIFDSCHSASGTREEEFDAQDQRYRSADPTLDIPYDIDDDVFKFYNINPSLIDVESRDAELLLYTDQASHVHLAACGIHEKALEQAGRGRFTLELLKKIRASKVSSITYHDLLKCLDKMSNQSPQCYGKNKNRFLFDARVSSVTFIPVLFEDSSWILEAGEASGVTKGSIWGLYEIATENSEPVGIFEVISFSAATAVLNPLSPMKNKYHMLYARFMRAGQKDELVLRVWISRKDRESLFGDNFNGKIQDNGLGYLITSIRDSADIVLEVCSPSSIQTEGKIDATQAEVVFQLCDDLAKRYGVEKLQKRKPARIEEVEVVLFAAAKWLWHLRRGNSDSKSSGKRVSMKMLKIANHSIRGMPVQRLREPIEIPDNRGQTSSWSVGHLFRRMVGYFNIWEAISRMSSIWSTSRSIVVDDVAEIEVDSSLYGFRLTSNTPLPVYVRMFYFDPTDLSIKDIFGHNAANGDNNPDIICRGKLVIGDGAHGGAPVRLMISSGQQVELGYMKVFWCTRPLEVDDIQQNSPFSTGSMDSRSMELARNAVLDDWGTACVGIVLRQPK
ncbi:hypothetical protein OPQ81_003615 [Rhizoctonia solani]|nr:hypothetical protein OPQ81_003615 [Rhizoctonia solani]